ncbi:MAG: aminoglycoside phosphotransferase family protein [Bdellovibrionaceae bacterium]|nr:aminoglycoside phosphotransferase family protein [Pseudobdellovibrionaceae bacterium]
MLSKKPLPSFLNYLNLKGITPVAGDGGHRKYYRLTTPNSSYVLMHDPDIKAQYKISQKHTFSFVNMYNLFKENNISVPKIEKIFLEESCILLEDLGDCSLYSTKDNALQLYKQSLQELIKIQNIKKDINLPMFQSSFDLNFLIQEFTQSLLSINNFYHSKNLLTSLSKELVKEIHLFCTFLNQSSFCLVHRDYHSRNIMVKKQQIKIIDFQDARLGHPLYDLASLLEDPYAKLSCEKKEELKAYFKKQASSLFLNDFNTHYYSISIHRLLKASASFIKLANNENNKVHNYLIDLPHAVKQSYDYVMKLNYPNLQTFIADLYKHK